MTDRPPDDDASAPEQLANPWWIPPFLGRVPRGIEPEHLRILSFVAFAMLFENYDLGLIGAVLPQISDEFGLSDVAKGYFLSAIDFGALPSLLLVPLADRIGRRRLLLGSVVGMSLGSAGTALAPTVESFAVLQILTRTFAVTASMVSFIIVAEEFPAEHRGWGIGMLGSIGATGFGLSALAYSQIDRLPYGWRSIYMIGGLAIFLLPVFRKRIQETRRFQAVAHRQDPTASIGVQIARGLAPLLQLMREHPRRALAIGILGVLSTAGHRPAFRFVSDFVQNDHGWSPGQYATMTIIGGMIGIVGSVAAGRLGDRFGRRSIGALMLVPFPIVTYGFYTGPGATVVPFWIAMVFISMASGVILRALATELFPTELRGAGAAWATCVETLGAGGGLLLFAGIETTLGARTLTLSLVALLSAISCVGFLLLPRTHGIELEDIANDSR